MNKYQIYEATENFNHAGSKATADIARIAEQSGFCCLRISQNSIEESIKGKIGRQIGYFFDWKKADKAIEPESVVLLQHPFHHRQLTREKTLERIMRRKKCHIISLVHDVEELRRYRYSPYYAREFAVMLSLADQIIVHNDAMKEWFVARGVKESRLVSLRIFDYLIQGDVLHSPRFEKSLTIAGNLDTAKSGYIKKLCDLMPIQIDLYGPNFDENLNRYENIRYCGEVSGEEIHAKLTRGFGLVWDGMETSGCQGDAGKYLKYNNPHKLSLYLAAGLPVITWNGAAEAAFVKEHQVGFCIDRIEECIDVLNQMSMNTWTRYVENVGEVGKKLREGYYTKRALNIALNRIGV